MIAESEGLSFDIRMRILAAIEQLSDIQQRVIQGLFYQGKSQTEVGKDLGISQRQVSRMKERILSEMRETYQPEDAN
ncbi:sigma-70 family RNA polymerase sigma factor [Candidatus Bipolaricaulota bacterium]